MSLSEEFLLQNPLSKSLIDSFRKKLLSWYRKSHRNLPWRNTKDPYAIWISEIMLQQTRVDTVKEYYNRFLEKYKTVKKLANAPLEEVLGYWSGLGYYSRARNLYAAACEVREKYEGNFPKEYKDLLSLPGVGRYTAGAIGSIAYGTSLPVVDGNVIRVFSRIFSIGEPITLSSTQKQYWNLAEMLIPPSSKPHNDPGDFNQALMELGATTCLPKNPSCLLCPLSMHCSSNIKNTTHLYPPPKSKQTLPKEYWRSLLLLHKGKILLGKRVGKGLFAELYEPPTLIERSKSSNPDLFSKDCKEKMGLSITPYTSMLRQKPHFSHTLSHKQLFIYPYLLIWPAKEPPQLTSNNYQKWIWMPLASKEFTKLGIASWVQKLIKQIPAWRKEL